MSNKTVHTIRSQAFNVVTDNGKEALSLQSRISYLNQREIPVLLNRVLDAFEIEDKSALFENIELDLGKIQPDNFDREILIKLESALEHYLLLAFRNKNENNNLSILSSFKSKSGYVIFYLTKGYYNWNERPSGSPKDWLKELLLEKHEKFKTELLTIAKREEVRLRLIFQFDDELLELLVEFIYPQRAEFIIEFKRDVLSRHEKKPLLEVSSSKMRNAVWEVILEYIFLNSGSYQSRKAVLKHLIGQLAIKYGLRLDVFMRILKNSINELTLTDIHQFELGAIFSELLQEIKIFDTLDNKPTDDQKLTDTPEKLLNYYFMHSSLPFHCVEEVEQEIVQFVKVEPLRARTYFSALIKKIKFDDSSSIAQLPDRIIREIILNLNISDINEFETLFLNIFERSNVWNGPINNYKSYLNSNRNRLILHAYFRFLRLKQTRITCLILSVMELLNIPGKLMLHVLENLVSDPRYKSNQQLKSLLFWLNETQDGLKQSQFTKVTNKDEPELAINLNLEFIEGFRIVTEYYMEIRLLIIDANTFLRINKIDKTASLIAEGCRKISLFHQVQFWHTIICAENTARYLFPELAIEFRRVFNIVSNKNGQNLYKIATEDNHNSRAFNINNYKKPYSEIDPKNDLIYNLNLLVSELKLFISRASGQNEVFWKISELVNAIAKKYKISVYSVIEQCSMLSVSEAVYEIKVKEYLNRFKFSLQVKSVEYSKNLILFYINNETLPYWASTSSMTDLQRHAKIFIKTFRILLPNILKNRQSKENLIKILDTDGFNALLIITNPRLSEKLLSFHSRFEAVLHDTFGSIRNNYFEQLQKFRIQIVNQLLLEDDFKDEKIFKYYWEVVLASFKIDPDKLKYILSNSKFLEYFNRNIVRAVLKKYIVSHDKNNNDFQYAGLSIDAGQKDVEIKFKKMLDALKVSEVVEQKQIIVALCSIYDNNKLYFYTNFFSPVVRNTITYNCSIEILDEFIFAITPENNKSLLGDVIKLHKNFKQYLTSTQYDKIVRSFYSIYLLKLADDNSNKWNIMDWTSLIFQNMTRTLNRDDSEKLVEQLIILVANNQLGTNIENIVNNLKYKFQQTSLPANKKMERRKMDNTNNSELDIANDESIFVCNAGIVIISPFIPRLFDMMGLLDNGVFKNDHSRIKAIYALYFAVTGKTEAEENELVINKIICGIGVNIPVTKFMEFDDKEKSLIESMLSAVIQQWSILKKTSIAGLRETFLQREGKLEIKELEFKLTVKQSGVDVLLDQIPWGIHTLKLSWMEKIINVEWR